jgi:tetratricopeptide (TPR) repeat protein
VGWRQRFVRTAQRELATLRPGVHYGMAAVLHTWHWCCEGLFELGRGKEALSLGLGARAAIETAFVTKPEESDRARAGHHLSQLGFWLLREGRPAEAEECLQRVLNLAEGMCPEKRAEIEAAALGTLAQVHKKKNDFSKVIHYAQRAMEVRRQGWVLARSARSGGLSPPRRMHRRIRRRRT